MKIRILIIFFAFGLFSCSPKVGCPAQENLQAETNRKGEFKSGRGKSALFSPRQMRKFGKG